MRTNKKWISYVVFILLGIGIVSKILEGEDGLLIAVIVLGAVFLLYKYPPRRRRPRLAKKTFKK